MHVCRRDDPVYLACGAHINRVLTEADWPLDTLCVYDLTYPPERS